MDEAGSQTTPVAGGVASPGGADFVGPPDLSIQPSEALPALQPAQPAVSTIGQGSVPGTSTIAEPELPLPPPQRTGTLSIDPATAIAVAVVVGGLLLAAWMRGRGGRTGGAASERRAERQSRGAASQTENHEYGADLEQTARALAALVREADARIAELKRLKGEMEAAESPREAAERDRQRASRESAFAAEPPRGPGMARSQSRTGREVAPEPAPAACADPVAGRVYELADSGLTPVQIASMLHEHTGKIELILALRRTAAR